MDIVLTHVDFECEKWRNAYEYVLQTEYKPELHTNDSATRTRFINHGELRYVLRSIAKNIPWIRNVYLVIDDFMECPDGLSDLVIIVRHSKLYGDLASECLPTFNSQSIETLLHRIDGISDPFLYFNDDMFVGQPIHPADLIHDSKLAVFATNIKSKRGIPKVTENGFRCAWKNVNRILDYEFGYMIRNKLHHSPYVISPRLMDQIWIIFRDQMNSTVRSKFRSITDVNVSPALHPYFAIHTDQGFISDLIRSETIYLFLADQEGTRSKLEELSKNLPHFFCLEDEDGEIESDHMLREFLQQTFPDPCRYERS